MIDEKQVFESLNNAVDNGYNIHEWDTDAIVEDLCSYDAQYENVSQSDLKPFIEKWLKVKQNPEIQFRKETKIRPTDDFYKEKYINWLEKKFSES